MKIYLIHLDLATKKSKIAEIEEVTMSPDFWSDSEKAQGVMRDLRVLRDTVSKLESIKERSLSISKSGLAESIFISLK